jgi:hypothetical protein
MTKKSDRRKKILWRSQWKTELLFEIFIRFQCSIFQPLLLVVRIVQDYSLHNAHFNVEMLNFHKEDQINQKKLFFLLGGPEIGKQNWKI